LSRPMCVRRGRDVVDHAVLKIKEHRDSDAESASILPVETGPPAWCTSSVERRRTERCPDTSPVIDRQRTVGPAAADMHRYQWSTMNAGHSSSQRRHVRPSSTATSFSLHHNCRKQISVSPLFSFHCSLYCVSDKAKNINLI